MIKRFFLGFFLLLGCAQIQASTERLASPDGRVRPRLKGVRRQVIDRYLPNVVPVKNAVTQFTGYGCSSDHRPGLLVQELHCLVSLGYAVRALVGRKIKYQLPVPVLKSMTKYLV